MSSTVALPVDVERVRDAIALVRDDAPGPNRIAWTLLGHVEGNPNVIDIVAENSSADDTTLDGLIDALKDDQVMYAMIRLSTTIDMSTTVKFIYVHWIGEDVAFAKKGRFGVVSGSVEEFFHPYHLLVETGSTDDLEQEALITKLEESSFTRNKVITGSVEGRQERGFTQYTTRNGTAGSTTSGGTPSSGGVGSARHHHTNKPPPGGANVTVDEGVYQALSSVRDDTSDVTWLLTHFAGSDIKTPLVTVATGEGGVDELAELLQYDEAAFGLYRTTDVIDDIETVKFVYITWLGEDIRPMAKAKLSTVAGAIQQVFTPVHVAVTCFNNSDKDDLVNIVKDKVSSSSGSKSFVK